MVAFENGPEYREMMMQVNTRLGFSGSSQLKSQEIKQFENSVDLNKEQTCKLFLHDVLHSQLLIMLCWNMKITWNTSTELDMVELQENFMRT